VFNYHQKVDELKELIQKELKEALSKCCLTLDGWMSPAVESFLGITCHYVDNEFRFRSFSLDLKLLVEAHSSDFIHSQLIDVLKDWDIEDKV
jgi:hypothetical protein